MNSKSNMQGRFYAHSLVALACAGVLSAAPVTAEEKKDAASEETITVTGSRISNPNVVSPTPISTLTAEDIKSTGAVNIGDIMTRLPQLATTFTMGNSGRFIGTVGTASQDLRNLGTDRTLVLVNGRRFVGSSAGSTRVDTNLIPASWVEKVDIITGGASAVYGADAVSGVVNFVLKKDYEGIDINAQLNQTEDGFRKRFGSVTAGQNFAEGRGNVAVSLERSEQDAFEFSKRFGNQAYRTIRLPGSTNTALYPDAAGYTTTESGTFTMTRAADVGNRYVFNPDGTHRRQRFSGPFDATGCSDCDRIDTNQVAQLEPDYARTSFSSVASFQFSDEHRGYFEGTYSEVDVRKFSQPAFGSYDIAADNAYATPSLRALIESRPSETITVSRFDVDAGRRGEDIERSTARVVLGVDGFISEDWAYDTSVVYGKTEESRDNLNNRIVDRFNASIDAVVNPANNQIVCRSTLYPGSVNTNTGEALDAFSTQGCIPTSIFGVGAINPSARDWFNATTLTTAELTQLVAGGTVSNNNLFEMPGDAGSASLVLGAEYRKEESQENTDPLDQQGLTFLNAIPDSGGEYSVKELFAQFALPLLTEKAFAKSLSIDAAVRGSEYTTAGRTTAWRYGMDWALDDNLRFRGTSSSAVRAPNIGELFGGQSQNFASFKDPCDISRINNGSATRAANCAALGVPVGFESNQTSTYEGVSGSNPDLDPETGETITIGFVATPQFIENFELNADYWEIELTDAISSMDPLDIAERCVDAGSTSNSYCVNVPRDPVTHEITSFKNVNMNIAATTTKGVDIGARYKHQLFSGDVRWDLNATKTLEFKEFAFQEDPSNFIDQNGTSGFPEWKATLSARYTLDKLSLSWSYRYFSEMLRVSNQSYSTNPISTKPITSGSGNFNDARVSYNFDNGLQTYFGINNVFDRDPPVNFFGTGFGSALYDNMGRGFYAGANYRF